ncbi:MAG: Bug family tripartite tricarboxylate transporter substrate binding protein [Burkholderiales bacterium]
MSRFVKAALSIAAGAAVALHPAYPQTYPTKPIRLVVAFPAGGAQDNVGRPFGQALGEALGARMIIDNRGGAGGLIGTEIAAKAPADGYTLTLCSLQSHSISPQLYSHVAYDPFKDFEPITLVATAPIILAVHDKLPLNNVNDFVNAAKAKPGSLSYGTAGFGTLAAEMFTSLANIKLHHVYYKGGAESVIDMIAGRLDSKFDSAPSIIATVEANRVKALAISRSARWPDIPNVPTFVESGWPQYQAGVWFGLCAPAKTPKPILERLHNESMKVLASNDFRERLRPMVTDPVGNSPQQFAVFLRAEYEKYGKVIRANNLKAD